MLKPPDTYAEFMERVRCLCAWYNGSVTSGIRSTKRNKKVGGVDKSYHRLERGGMAVDIVLDSMNVANRTEFVVASRCLGFRALDEGDHIHLQPEKL